MFGIKTVGLFIHDCEITAGQVSDHTDAAA